MPSLAARAIRFIFDWNLRPGGKRILSSTGNTCKAIQTLYLRPQSYAPPANLGVEICVERIDMNDWPLYRASEQSLNTTKTDQRGALLYLHGGAWLHEVTSAHWQLVVHLARTTGLDVLVPIYPLIPRPTATAVQVIKSLIEICQNSTQPIVCIAGDSAGGNIALSLAQQLQLKTPEIAAKLQSIVLISPVLDATFDHPDITEYEKHDPWLAVPGLKVVAQHWADDTPLSDPVVSPLFGDIANLPPLLLLSGTDDLLNADARRLSARFQGQDTNACVAGSVTLDKFEYVEADQMIHVYPLLPCWEGEQARKKISEFIVKNGNKEGL